MCECHPDPQLHSVDPEAEGTSDAATPVVYETRPFWTYSLKYCDNPQRHIFGSMPCCWHLKIVRGSVDPNDFLSPPPLDNPLVYEL
jgi:hypothetical protein